MTFGEHWHARPWLRDAVIPAVLLALIAFTASSGYPDLLSICLVLPLFWRRTAPEAVFGIVVALGLLQVVTMSTPIIGDLAVPLVIQANAAYARNATWRWSTLVAGLGASVLGPISWYTHGPIERAQAVPVMGVCAVSVGVAFAIGITTRSHAAVSSAAEAERQRLVSEQQRRGAEIAAATERTRIARELHDIVAHSLSVVVVQAEGGRAAARAKPELAQEVLGTIAGTARAALNDMRRLVGVLRTGGEPESSHPDYAPAPTVADIPALVEQIRTAGQDVVLQISGEERTVPPAVGLAAYRLVQESLTNVIKHGGPQARTEVCVHYAPHELQMSVIDDGRGAAAGGDGQGNGLIGMRERVTLQGGTVQAHPRGGGGFLVSAAIPTDENDRKYG